MARQAGKKKRSWSYSAPSFDKVKERAEARGGNFDNPVIANIDMFKARQGDNYIRFLPIPDSSEYGMDVWIHRRVGSRQSDYPCLKEMSPKKDKPCAICDAYDKAVQHGEGDEAKKLKAAHQHWVWILDRNGDEPNQPVLWRMSWTQNRDVSKVTMNKRNESVIGIADPDTGYDLSFVREGEGLRTRYSAYQVDRDDTPITDDIKTYDQVLDYVEDNPLKDIINFYDNDYLTKIMSGTQEEPDQDLDDGDDEEENEQLPRTRRRTRDEDEADEESDTDEDEVEEEADDEESDEEDDEEEADEEETPRQRRRARAAKSRR